MRENKISHDHNVLGQGSEVRGSPGGYKRVNPERDWLPRLPGGFLPAYRRA